MKKKLKEALESFHEVNKLLGKISGFTKEELDRCGIKIDTLRGIRSATIKEINDILIKESKISDSSAAKNKNGGNPRKRIKTVN